MGKEEIFEGAKQAIVECNKSKAEEVVRQGLSEGIDPMEIMNKGLIPGIGEVGDLFGEGKLFLPELIQAADVMRLATEQINAALPPGVEKQGGKIVIGTVQGDIHDIGKTIVVSFLKANGFEVYDLGRDVPTLKFIEKAEEVGAHIIGTSALLTTTMEGQRKLENDLKRLGLKEKYKTIVGGAPVTQRWATRIGADAYAEDAVDGVRKIKKLLGRV
jgi:corrinoid protein of di/trimethylamine methyltransferase